MRYSKLRLIAMLLLSISIPRLYAQESINASGGNSVGIAGSISASIGQLVFTTVTGVNASVAQGVQQPFEISVTGIDVNQGINLIVNAYPNPTTYNVFLEIDGMDISKLCYHLYDAKGEHLRREVITGNTTNIVLNDLSPATYFVAVTQEDKRIKSFKIIKN